MSANYTAHLTSVLVVLVVAFAAFVTACAFLHCDAFTNKTHTNTLISCVFRSFVNMSTFTTFVLKYYFLRLRLHYSHFANVHGLRVIFWYVLQYVYFICSK